MHQGSLAKEWLWEFCCKTRVWADFLYKVWLNQWCSSLFRSLPSTWQFKEQNHIALPCISPAISRHILPSELLRKLAQKAYQSSCGLQVASVTELTNALEGVTDMKHVTGELVNNLHAAEKHLRKNKLKVYNQSFTCFTIAFICQLNESSSEVISGSQYQKVQLCFCGGDRQATLHGRQEIMAFLDLWSLLRWIACVDCFCRPAGGCCPWLWGGAGQQARGQNLSFSAFLVCEALRWQVACPSCLDTLQHSDTEIEPVWAPLTCVIWTPFIGYDLLFVLRVSLTCTHHFAHLLGIIQTFAKL